MKDFIGSDDCFLCVVNDSQEEAYSRVSPAQMIDEAQKVREVFVSTAFYRAIEEFSLEASRGRINDSYIRFCKDFCEHQYRFFEYELEESLDVSVLCLGSHELDLVFITECEVPLSRLCCFFEPIHEVEHDALIVDRVAGSSALGP